jgi:hypothetical protein
MHFSSFFLPILNTENSEKITCKNLKELEGKIDSFKN